MTTEFCTTADVWCVKEKKHSKPEHWDAFWRNRRGGVSIEVKQKDSDKRLDPYKKTLEAIEKGKIPAPVKSTRSESMTSGVGVNSTKHKIWPKDIFGNPTDFRYQIAHLLPAGQQTHAEWCGVAAAVLGLPKNSSVDKQLMATRGVRKGNDEELNNMEEDSKTPCVGSERGGQKRRAGSQNANKKSTKRQKIIAQDGSDAAKKPAPSAPRSTSKKLKFADDASGDKSQDTARSSVARKLVLVDNTGVVHFISNKIRLKNKGILLDGNVPTLLIVPCMTVMKANKWKGEKYRAVVLAGLPASESNVPEAYSNSYPGLSQEAITAGAEEDARLGSNEARKRFQDLKLNKEQQKALLTTARQGLEEAVLGLTEYVKGARTNNAEELEERFEDMLKDGILVPKSLAGASEKPVLIVEFGGLNDRAVHPAPDPLLLLAKAAAVWGKMVGVTILVNGELKDEEDLDSLDEVAEEDYIEIFRNSTPQIPNEISVVTPELSSIFGH